MEVSREQMNLHQKMLKIADAAGVLRKEKQGYNYKYVGEEDVQAQVTAGMQKYGVMLYASLVDGTLKIQPYTYDKPKTKKVKENGKDVIVDYTIPVNEIIVSAEVQYTWVNVDNPNEQIVHNWAYVGQMEDAAQAFGAGATYGNRYYLIKALQLATTEDDPDNWRSKQKAASKHEEDKLASEQAEIIDGLKAKVKELGGKFLAQGGTKEAITQIVANCNDGNDNYASITTADTLQSIINELTKLVKAKPKKTKQSEEVAK